MSVLRLGHPVPPAGSWKEVMQLLLDPSDFFCVPQAIFFEASLDPISLGPLRHVSNRNVTPPFAVGIFFLLFVVEQCLTVVTFLFSL